MLDAGSLDPAAGTGAGALLVADGDVPERRQLDIAWPGWDRGHTLVVAADGGALKAERLGFPPHLVVGDADSLAPADIDRLRGAGVAIERASTDKDESDLELALLAAVARGAERLLVLGAFGGARLDHGVANLLLLADARLAGRPVTLLDAQARVRLLRAPDTEGRPMRLDLPGPAGGLVSLLPIGDIVEGVVTEGLRYPLRDEPLELGPSRGLSNVRTSVDAAVSLRRGLLLVIETATAAGDRP